MGKEPVKPSGLRRGGKTPGQLTLLSISLGLGIAIVMTAANVYLGLYAGMTVSASIPAAVLGLGAYRMLGKKDVLGANIVQTLASSGESLAAGAIFTIPALVLVGAWQDFKFWPTTLIAMCGGLLGIAFMVPLRRLLIVESPELTYPEGVACAEVLRTGMSGKSGGGGVLFLMKGFVAGGAFKLAASGLGILSGTLEWAWRIGGGSGGTQGATEPGGGRVFFFGSDLSPALLAVGFITGLEVSLQVFTGGVIAWVAALPMLTPPKGMEGPALDAAWGMWSQRIRYLGVGAMVVGGIWSIFSIRKGIAQGLGSLFAIGKAGSAPKPEPSEENMPGPMLLALLAFCAALTFALYWYLLKNPALSLLTTALMMAAAFLFTGVSSYIVGLVGSSNNPVSGMTISALLGTGGFLLLLGFRGDSAILATLGVAAVVCCAACSAADCSQDLKTGHILGASPKHQQYAEVIGAIVPAFVIAPVLALLHHSYVIGAGLKAPQATLFASLAGGMFGKGQIPMGMVGAGAAIGVALIGMDAWLKSKGSRFRLHPMPVAVGMYLPFTLSVPIFLGGLIRYLGLRRSVGREGGPESGNAGVLLASGLIAGESILGVALAVCIYFKWTLAVPWHPAWLSWISLGLFLGLALYLSRTARKTLE